MGDPGRGKIMIVDDNVSNLTLGRNLLREYYDVYLAPSPGLMFTMLEKIRPDLILLDIEMPGMSGYEAIAGLKADARFASMPVIFLTAQNDEASELKGFDLGAADYISKPFSAPLLRRRIEHQLLLARQNETIQHHADNLSAQVKEKVREVISLQNTILGTVADLVEFRDRFTGGHISRTQFYLKTLIGGLEECGLYTGEMSGWDMDYVLQSAQLHDVGKIAIPDAILNKPARLTPEEFEVMKTHVTVGIDAVNRIINKTESHAFLRHTLNIVGAHHEKWDGTGYPYGLKGGDIPLEGRLMAVADVYDALVSWRPYKEKLSHAQAREIIKESGGTHFDPVLVEVFLRAESDFERILPKSPLEESARWGATALTSDMEVGVPQIDVQHKELVSRINSVVSMGAKPASKEETQKALDFLEEYIIRHFTDEESLQRQSGYPKYEGHRLQHNVFAGEFENLKKEFAERGVSDGFSVKFNNSVINWAVRHIKSMDVEFGRYYRAYMAEKGGNREAAGRTELARRQG